ncbi:MAG: PD-(D/E)XK nuclease family protein [Planctomycetaceae bacterium]|nr:PD-(D/E)XK nuclease family protein [Planctomycetaceae bacterium]
MLGPTTNRTRLHQRVRRSAIPALSYRFRYVDQVPEPSVSASLVFGRSIHAAVEHWFRTRMDGSAEPAVDDLHYTFRAEWFDAGRRQEIRYGKGDEEAKLFVAAHRIIETFCRSEVARPDGRIIAIEEELRCAISSKLPDIFGRIDLAVRKPDALTVIDFKTSRSAWNELHCKEAELQAAVYSLLAEPLSEGSPNRVDFTVITKTRSPSVSSFTIDTSAIVITRAKTTFHAVRQAIRAELFFPNPSPQTCSACSFRNHCDAWTALVRTGSPPDPAPVTRHTVCHSSPRAPIRFRCPLRQPRTGARTVATRQKNVCTGTLHSEQPSHITQQPHFRNHNPMNTLILFALIIVSAIAVTAHRRGQQITKHLTSAAFRAGRLPSRPPSEPAASAPSATASPDSTVDGNNTPD